MIEIAFLNGLGDFLIDQVEQWLHKVLRKLKLQFSDLFDKFSQVFRVKPISTFNRAHEFDFGAYFSQLVCFIFADGQVAHS